MLTQHINLANSGSSDLDSAIFCWAIKTLNKKADLNVVRLRFTQMSDAYHDNERFFHHGLGHPRSLLPDASQAQYQTVLLNNDSANVTQLIEIFEDKFLDALPHTENREKEAQEILAAFYHDVVHRKGKKPIELEKYKQHNNNYSTINGTTPLTRSLLNSDQALKPEELSCIVAEDALRDLIASRHLIPVLLAIINTIPFSDISTPENLTNRLISTLDHQNLYFTPAEIREAVNVAIAVTNRDHASYAADTLDEFNQKSWAMMLERNSNLSQLNYHLEDEADAIAGFYSHHKKLYQDLQQGISSIYHSQNNPTLAAQLNNKAKKTLELDMILQGIQLGALAIRIAILNSCNLIPINNSECDKQFDSFLMKIETNAARNHLTEVPDQVIEILNHHGKECIVNGMTLTRGSNNGLFSLRLVKLIGLEKLLDIASRYKQVTYDEITKLINTLSIHSFKNNKLNYHFLPASALTNINQLHEDIPSSSSNMNFLNK